LTENGDPYENAIAERVNGIFKQEFGLDQTNGDTKSLKLLAAPSIKIYNSLRSHLSCDMLTPKQMYKQNKVKLKQGKEKNQKI